MARSILSKGRGRGRLPRRAAGRHHDRIDRIDRVALWRPEAREAKGGRLGRVGRSVESVESRERGRLPRKAAGRLHRLHRRRRRPAHGRPEAKGATGFRTARARTTSRGAPCALRRGVVDVVDVVGSSMSDQGAASRAAGRYACFPVQMRNCSGLRPKWRIRRIGTPVSCRNPAFVPRERSARTSPFGPR